MQVVRNVVFDPFLLPGGGATEMAVAHELARSGPLEVQELGVCKS